MNKGTALFLLSSLSSFDTVAEPLIRLQWLGNLESIFIIRVFLIFYTFPLYLVIMREILIILLTATKPLQIKSILCCVIDLPSVSRKYAWWPQTTWSDGDEIISAFETGLFRFWAYSESLPFGLVLSLRIIRVENHGNVKDMRAFLNDLTLPRANFIQLNYILATQLLTKCKLFTPHSKLSR